MSAIVRPCPTHISGCPCINDNPFANLSSEAPDPPDVIRMGYFMANPPINSPDNYWDVPLALGSCAGTDAQDTQDCADGESTREGDANQRTFRSVARTCTVPCPDGSSFSYTLKAGAVTSTTQALADYLASTVCLYRAGQARQCGPTAVTGAASNIEDDSATLNGTVNPNGVSTTTFFQWGTSTSYGNITPITNIGSGNITLPFAANITGLTPGTTYHYRIVAVNSKGTNMGADATFDTVATLPTPVAWWPMDDAAGNLIDIINGVGLVRFLVNGATTYHAVGKVDFSIGLSGAAAFGTLDVSFDTGIVPLSYAGNGIDITFWHRIRLGLNANLTIFTYTFPFGDVINFQYKTDTQAFTLTFGPDIITFNLNVIDDTFHMYRVFFNPVSGTFGIQIDNGAIQSLVTAQVELAGATGEFLFAMATDQGANPSNINVFWDEAAIWPRVLTQGELDQIWNSGNGTTWPL